MGAHHRRRSGRLFPTRTYVLQRILLPMARRARYRQRTGRNVKRVTGSLHIRCANSDVRKVRLHQSCRRGRRAPVRTRRTEIGMTVPELRRAIYALLRILSAFLHALSATLDCILRALGATLRVVLRGVICLLGAVFHGAAGVLGSFFGLMASALRVLLGRVVFAGVRLLAECHQRRDG